MALISVNTLAINGVACESEIIVNCELLNGGMKSVWIITDEVGLVKMDFEDNGGTEGVVIYEGKKQIVVTETPTEIKDLCCCVAP